MPIPTRGRTLLAVTVTVTVTVTALVLVGGVALAAPALAQQDLAGAYGLVRPEPAGAYDLTTGRLWSLVGALAGVVGLAFGGWALVRSGRRGRSGRGGAVVALVAGPVGAVVGGLVVAAAEGGPGTGYGIVGGWAALVIGVVATATGGLALTRLRRTPAPGVNGR
ncbi:DUF6223 family protein [Nonomuraea gerenzanensis]|uniref:Uncharacterized protein n=1 Tax=Nonomuraea gerenzanensis TaxID=93944 RepID=A0A1M4EA36_9ACTN|nr:DUF6223 family protein [Nonomuraea gerenzanensis]UBU17787.1 DUF6223 family protein [Nonomuraea gerenzanensis]SBO95568.1 hypothetical protein BN4615_P5084 [Nonomuraea gerenzanensis]